MQNLPCQRLGLPTIFLVSIQCKLVGIVSLQGQVAGWPGGRLGGRRWMVYSLALAEERMGGHAGNLGAERAKRAELTTLD